MTISCPVHAHRALPGSHSPHWVSHKPSPAMLRAVCLVQLVLLCCASRGSCSAQEGPEGPPVVLFSASPCSPILVCNVYITPETGKNIRCVQAGLLSLFKKSLCELPEGQKRPPASPHGLLHPAALGSAIYQAPTAALSPFNFTLHLLDSQPAFIFAAFRKLGSKGYLRFASLE